MLIFQPHIVTMLDSRGKAQDHGQGAQTWTYRFSTTLKTGRTDENVGNIIQYNKGGSPGVSSV